MKLVRESLLEFHKTGDPLGALGVGLNKTILDATDIEIYDSKRFLRLNKLPKNSEERTPDFIQNFLKKCRSNGFLTAFIFHIDSNGYKNNKSSTYLIKKGYNYIRYKGVVYEL